MPLNYSRHFRTRIWRRTTASCHSQSTRLLESAAHARRYSADTGSRDSSRFTVFAEIPRHSASAGRDKRSTRSRNHLARSPSRAFDAGGSSCELVIRTRRFMRCLASLQKFGLGRSLAQSDPLLLLLYLNATCTFCTDKTLLFVNILLSQILCALFDQINLSEQHALSSLESWLAPFRESV